MIWAAVANSWVYLSGDLGSRGDISGSHCSKVKSQDTFVPMILFVDVVVTSGGLIEAVLMLILAKKCAS